MVTQSRPGSRAVGRRPSNLDVADCCVRRSHASKKRRLYAAARPCPRCAVYCMADSRCDVIIATWLGRRPSHAKNAAETISIQSSTAKRLDSIVALFFVDAKRSVVRENRAVYGLPLRPVTWSRVYIRLTST